MCDGYGLESVCSPFRKKREIGVKVFEGRERGTVTCAERERNEDERDTGTDRWTMPGSSEISR